MRSYNPVFRSTVMMHRTEERTVQMRLYGTILKAIFLIGLLALSALFVWRRFVPEQMGKIRFLLKCSVPLTFLVGWMTYFKPQWSFVTAPIYALSQGVLVGAVSSMAEIFFPGVVGQAIPLTFFVLFGMLLLYAMGVIQVTRRLQSVIVVSLLAVSLTYLVEWVLAVFFGGGIPYIHEGGAIGIAFSVFVVLLASFTLLLDFEFIVQCIHKGAPRYMEWYCAYGLMVTLVWLYIKILELLVKSARRNRR